MNIRNWFKNILSRNKAEDFEIPNEEWENILKLAPEDSVIDEEDEKMVAVYSEGYEAGCKDVGNIIKKSMEIDKIIINGPATIILWKDKTKTIAKAMGGDEMNPSAGIGIAMAKKMVGNAEFRKILEKYDTSLPENDYLVELED